MSPFGELREREVPSKTNGEFDSYSVSYLPTAENNKELMCVHGKLNSVVKANVGLREEDKADEFKKSCILYQLDPTGQSRFGFKYGKFVIPKENESFDVDRDIVSYSVMIKDYSDNKNKYFIKDTTFNVPNQGFGQADNMLRPIYEEEFDYERSENGSLLL